MVRNRHGMGLGMVIIIVCLLYYTGMNTVIANKVSDGFLRVESACYDGMGSLSTNLAAPVCGGTASAVRFIGDVLTEIGEYLVLAKNEVVRGIRSLSGGKDVTWAEIRPSASISGDSLIGSLTSSAEILAAKIQRGPTGSGGNVADRARNAIDSYVIGEKYLRENGSVRQALPWLQQGAAMPGYGVLAQIKLGDLYSQGGNGISADPAMAELYYSQALNSINQLQTNSSVQARQLLGSLNSSPEQVKQQLQQAIAAAKTR